MGRRTWGTIRKTSSGRYQARYPVPGQPGKQLSTGTTYDTKGQADEALAAIRAQIQRGEWKHPDQLRAEQEAANLEAQRRAQQEAAAATTVGEWAEHWLDAIAKEEAAGDKSPGTRRSYTSAIKPFLETFADKRLTDVTQPDVLEWWQDLAVRRGRGRNTTISRETRKNYYRAASNLYNSAVQHGKVEVSPVNVKGAGTKTAGRDEPMAYVPTPKDIDDLSAHLNPQVNLVVLLAYYCGLRQGEARALTLRDIRLHGDRPTVTVRRTIVKDKNGSETVRDVPKTDTSNRTLRLPDNVVKYLRGYVTQQGIRDQDQLLIAEEGAPNRVLADKKLREGPNRWHEARKAIGLHPSVKRLHDLRAAFLTRAGRQGATLQELMRLAGQSQPETLMRYLVAEQDRLDSIVLDVAGNTGEPVGQVHQLPVQRAGNQ